MKRHGYGPKIRNHFLMGQLSAAFNSWEDSCPEEHTVNNSALLSPKNQS